MLQLIEHTAPDLIALRVSGHLNADDYKILRPLFKERVEHFSKIRVYAEMLDLEKITPQAIWEDLKIDIAYANKVSKAAIVGDRKWEEWLVKVSKPFVSGKMQYFDFQQRDAAWTWITEGDV